MAAHALIEKRPLLLASLAAAVAFYALGFTQTPGLWLIPVKGAAVGLLGLYALLHGASRDGRLLALMMALAALGDMAFEVNLGGAMLLFFLYQVVAISLYLRHPRKHATPTQRAAAVAMLVLTPLLFWLFPADRTMAWPSALYGLALGGMASCAWMSGFSRYRIGIGAVLLLAVQLLVVAGYGPLMGRTLTEELVWPLYYVGQLLITVGVVQAARKRHPEPGVVSNR